MGCGASTEYAEEPAPVKPPVTTGNPYFKPGEAAAQQQQQQQQQQHAPTARPTFAASYARGEKLGKGNYATVYKVTPKGNSSKVFAAKCIKKAALTPEDTAALAIEVKAMQIMRQHPNFVHLIEYFSEKFVRGQAPRRQRRQRGVRCTFAALALLLFTSQKPPLAPRAGTIFSSCWSSSRAASFLTASAGRTTTRSATRAR